MKYILLLLFFPAVIHAQVYPAFSPAIDSTTFTFTAGNLLTHSFSGVKVDTNATVSEDTPNVTIDTAGAALWQIGSTLKLPFSNGATPVTGIMTSTAHLYPPNANDFFVLKMGHIIPNMVVDIWHRYQTDSLHAGGIVEFSYDSGVTWMNIASCSLVNTQNFYTTSDTLTTGDAAFMGSSNGQQLSRLQFINCVIPGERTTATTCAHTGYVAWHGSDSLTDVNIFIRFRFRSDTSTDTLAGWLIDSIRVENTGCDIGPGYVPTISNTHAVSVYPNPAMTDFTITSSDNVRDIRIYNLIGEEVSSIIFSRPAQSVTVPVTTLPPGIYLVKINGTDVRKVVKE